MLRNVLMYSVLVIVILFKIFISSAFNIYMLISLKKTFDRLPSFIIICYYHNGYFCQHQND